MLSNWTKSKKKTQFFLSRINRKYFSRHKKYDQLSDHFKYVRNNGQFIRAESLEVLAPNLEHKKIGLAQNLTFNQSTPRQQKSNIELVKTETVEYGSIYLETVKLKNWKFVRMVACDLCEETFGKQQ